MNIEEFDVVIKSYSMDEIKQLLGEGRTDIRLKFLLDNNRPFYPSSDTKLIIETWEKKNKDKK